jgi:acyl carrier protein
MDIIANLNQIFSDVLELDEVNLKRETTANDIEEWDSLSHILLIVAIEKGFKLRFTSKEIQSWKNVGEMIDCIETKLK